MSNWWGKGWTMVGCPLRARVSAQNFSTSLGCFCQWTSFSDVLDMLPRNSFTSYVRTKLRIINRSLPNLANDSPCRVWSRGWTICLLYMGRGALLCLCCYWQLMSHLGRYLFYLFLGFIHFCKDNMRCACYISCQMIYILSSLYPHIS